MASIATQASTGTGGGSPTSYSFDVLASGLLVLRQGDSFSCGVHGATTVTGGSSSVLTNNKGTARVGDSLGCGHAIATGIDSIQVGN